MKNRQITSVLMLTTMTLGCSAGCSQTTTSNNSASTATGAVSSEAGMGNAGLSKVELGDAGLGGTSATPGDSSSLPKSAESEQRTNRSTDRQSIFCAN